MDPVAPLAMPTGPPAWGTVVLRSFRDDDVGMVMDLATDPYVPQIGSLTFCADRSAAIDYIDRQRGRITEGVGWSFCVADRETDEALGGIGLWLVGDDPRRATAGYAIAPRARGKGAAGQALRAVAAFAWTATRARRVEVFVEPWNIASLRTAANAGFVREALVDQHEELRGRKADMVRFALVRPGRG